MGREREGMRRGVGGKQALTVDRQIFSNLNMKVKELFVSTIRNYNLNKISNSKSSKSLFDIVNRMSGKLKSSINIGLSSAKESAEKFSLFFIDKIAKIREHLDTLCTSFPSHDEFYGS